jgi:hypothetical protein
MRTTNLISVLLLAWLAPHLNAAPPGSDVTSTPVDCEEGLECTRVVRWSNCGKTVITII